MITSIHKSDYIHTPWKNGLGVTEQIDLYPTSSSFLEGNYLWRLSTAHVLTDNPFSQFVGYHRYLGLVKGYGLSITTHQASKLLLPKSVIHFSGEDLINSTLINGPVQDLGLIYDSKKVAAQMTYCELKKNENTNLDISSFHYIFCISGEVHLDQHICKSGDCLKCDPSPRNTSQNSWLKLTAALTSEMYLIKLNLLDAQF